jgi:transcriptional regulator with XRE-family HTH domain
MRVFTLQPSPASVIAFGLRERRKGAGLSQQQLADLAGCSRGTVQWVENGHAGKFSPATIARISAVLLVCKYERVFRRELGETRVFAW